MTRKEKFAICKALHSTLPQEPVPLPLVKFGFNAAVNAIAAVVCPTPDENLIFKHLVLYRDNWVNDNPFKDDVKT